MPLEQAFFAREAPVVARELLGKKVVRRLGHKTLSGMVVETEAYLGQTDSASHAFRGRTPRNKVMFGPAGMAYVYLVYGLHHMLNVVTGPTGLPGAVLFRAIEPLQGQAHMQVLRQCDGLRLTNGPGKLCQALAIDRAFNCWNLVQGETLWLEPYQSIRDNQITTGPRIGIGYATPDDQQAPWRFWIEGNPYISK